MPFSQGAYIYCRSSSEKKYCRESSWQPEDVKWRQANQFTLPNWEPLTRIHSYAKFNKSHQVTVGRLDDQASTILGGSNSIRWHLIWSCNILHFRISFVRLSLTQINAGQCATLLPCVLVLFAPFFYWRTANAKRWDRKKMQNKCKNK